ncbi:hypothetical protein KI387_041874, partial [Taxus chinensis]
TKWISITRKRCSSPSDIDKVCVAITRCLLATTILNFSKKWQCFKHALGSLKETLNLLHVMEGVEIQPKVVKIGARLASYSQFSQHEKIGSIMSSTISKGIQLNVNTTIANFIKMGMNGRVVCIYQDVTGKNNAVGDALSRKPTPCSLDGAKVEEASLEEAMMRETLVFFNEFVPCAGTGINKERAYEFVISPSK